MIKSCQNCATTTKKLEEQPNNKRLSPSSIANKQILTRLKRTRCENAPKEGKVRACDNQPLLGYFNLEWFKVFYFLNKWKESIAIKTELTIEILFYPEEHQ
jgi:hypothetical protein